MPQPPSAGKCGPTSNKNKSCSQQRKYRRNHKLESPLAPERGRCDLRRLRADTQKSALFSPMCGLGCSCSQSAQ
eukprot:4956431-Prymnesium_polylepis.1